MPTNDGSADALIRRRHVLYVEGYDPQGAEGYHNLFSRSFRRFLKNWPLQTSHRRCADRFRRSRALDHRRQRPELAGRDPLRFPAPGADDPRQHGGADVAAGAARARLGAELSLHRHAVSHLPRLASIRPGADGVPADADLVARACRLGWLADRVAGDAADRWAARVRRWSSASRGAGLLQAAASAGRQAVRRCRSTATGRICWNMRAASRRAGIAASRPARIVSSRSRKPTRPTRSSWSATSGGGVTAPALWRARWSSIPSSAVTARALCC